MTPPVSPTTLGGQASLGLRRKWSPLPRNRKRRPGVSGIFDLGRAVHEILEVSTYKGYPKFGSKIIKAVCRSIAMGLERDGVVSINGFGTFKVRRMGPRLMPPIYVDRGVKLATPSVRPGRTKVVFQPAIQLMAMLNHETPNYKERRAAALWTKE